MMSSETDVESKKFARTEKYLHLNNSQQAFRDVDGDWETLRRVFASAQKSKEDRSPLDPLSKLIFVPEQLYLSHVKMNLRNYAETIRMDAFRSGGGSPSATTSHK